MTHTTKTWDQIHDQFSEEQRKSKEKTKNLKKIKDCFYSYKPHTSEFYAWLMYFIFTQTYWASYSQTMVQAFLRLLPVIH